MSWLVGFFIAPLLLMWSCGFSKSVGIVLAIAAALMIFLLGSVTGFLFEALFFPKNVSSYLAPQLFTNAYAESMDNLGQALIIPYIFVFDLFWLTLHYTFTHATFLMNAFQLLSLYIIFNFIRNFR